MIRFKLISLSYQQKKVFSLFKYALQRRQTRWMTSFLDSKCVCFKQVMIDSFLLSGSLETENKGGLSSLGTWLCNSQHIGFPLLPSAWIASILHTYQNTFRRSGFPFLRSTTSTYSYIAVSFISRRSSLASILLVVV